LTKECEINKVSLFKTRKERKRNFFGMFHLARKVGYIF
jgi:hypothetical protein